MVYSEEIIDLKIAQCTRSVNGVASVVVYLFILDVLNTIEFTSPGHGLVFQTLRILM